MKTMTKKLAIDDVRRKKGGVKTSVKAGFKDAYGPVGAWFLLFK